MFRVQGFGFRELAKNLTFTDAQNVTSSPAAG